MPGESDITLRVNTTAQLEGLTQTTAAVQQATAATNQWVTAANVAAPSYAKAMTEAGTKSQESVRRLNEEVKRHTVEQEKTRTATMNSGQAMLTLGRGIQDLQYGFGGVVNNIEGMTRALGGGAGLAGVMTLVGVGVSLLTNNLGETKAPINTAVEDTKKLADEAAKAAVALEKQAASARKTAESAAGYEESISTITEKYRQLNQQIELRLKNEEALRRAKLGEGDAQAARDLAEVDNALKRGVISDATAEERRAKIEMDSIDRRKKAADEAAGSQQSALINESNNDRLKAAGLSDTARRLKDAGKNILSDDERAAVKARVEADNKAIAAEQAKVDEANRAESDPARAYQAYKDKNEADNKDRKNRGEFQVDNETEVQFFERMRKQREESNRRIGILSDRGSQNRGILEADKNARDSTGVSSAKELEAEVKKLRDEVDRLRQSAEEKSSTADIIGKTRESQNREFDLRRETRGLQRDSRLTEFDNENRQKRQQQADEERRRQEAAEEKKGAIRGTFNSIREDAAGAGANGQGLDRMERALNAFLQGTQNNDLTFAKLADALEKAYPQLKERLDKLEAAMETVRSGH